MKKFRQWLQQHGSKALAISSGLGVLATATPVFAVDGSSGVPTEAVQSIMSSLTSQLTMSNIATIIASGIGGVVVIFLGWWGARKLVRMLTTAFSKGKIRL